MKGEETNMSNAFSRNEQCNQVADEKHVQHAQQSDKAEEGQSK